jgi:hypothetical protein
MINDDNDSGKQDPSINAKEAATKATAQRRTIPGNLMYISTPGKLDEAFAQLIKAPVPDNLSFAHMENVFSIKSGSARNVLAALKRLGFIDGSGKPTEIYKNFRSDLNRGKATYDAIRLGYGELFKRNEFAYRVSDDVLKDLIKQVTGLGDEDDISSQIFKTFSVVKKFIPQSYSHNEQEDVGSQAKDSNEPDQQHNSIDQNGGGQLQGLGLKYEINIVLPVSTDIDTYNKIFRALRENLLK